MPTPALIDVDALSRPSSPNSALAAPEGFVPATDITTPVYQLPADDLFARIRSVAAGQPRTHEAAVFAEHLQAHFVVRTPVLNFPDLVLAQVQPAGPSRSRLILFSRSVYGHSDFGVNRRRLEAWLKALKASLSGQGGPQR